ncbi:DNA-nicking endonuclease, Smr domain [Thiohalospira halophila DSM 15071]|uniref:DNA-nicking endonuclease, Smr domain n=1 Tax=Thiohalospira halophila DSM 15071 TaxID=1123397 RepID=A0A1I1NM71_9GAMM|nr:Smr/MutS family protein [Thiohalospira halophila]SFC98526.1 DNA-nicking endonuclease, Smr domain [Thiohalospira halophila DSM 15071]
MSRRRPTRPRGSDPVTEEERRLFREAVADVTPLESEPGPDAPPPPAPRPRFSRTGDRASADAGEAQDPPLTDGPALPRDGGEVLSFRRGGIQHKVMRRLANGQLTITAELDLHGLTREAARTELDRFLTGARQRQQCCIRVIHGKGGTDGSVLKGLVDAWLRQRPEVLAFASAPASAGGTGALLVLLARAR